MIYRYLKKVEWQLMRMVNFVFIFYSLLDYLKIRSNVKKNKAFINKEKGRTCFILLGGLSAKEVDLHDLVGKDVITTNHFFRTKENSLVMPKYHVITDFDFFNDGHMHDLERLGLKSTTFFLNGRHFKNQGNIENFKLFYPLLRVANNNINLALDGITTNFSTVTLNCIQLATYLGYTEINLIGFDFPPGHMPHFYKESEGEQEGENLQKQKVSEFEYCNLFWQYTNCHHEAYQLNKLLNKKRVKVFNMSKTTFVRAFTYKGFYDH